ACSRNAQCYHQCRMKPRLTPSIATQASTADRLIRSTACDLDQYASNNASALQTPPTVPSRQRFSILAHVQVTQEQCTIPGVFIKQLGPMTATLRIARPTERDVVRRCVGSASIEVLSRQVSGDSDAKGGRPPQKTSSSKCVNQRQY